jgi:hypothetical protein
VNNHREFVLGIPVKPIPDGCIYIIHAGERRQIREKRPTMHVNVALSSRVSNADGSVERGNRNQIDSGSQCLEPLSFGEISFSLFLSLLILISELNFCSENKGAHIFKKRKRKNNNKIKTRNIFWENSAGGAAANLSILPFDFDDGGGKKKKKEKKVEIRGEKEKRLCEMDDVCVSISFRYFFFFGGGLCRVTKGQFTKFWHLI